MSKAEKFENEKKRIIESCFAKKDSDGSGTLDLFHKQCPIPASWSSRCDLEEYFVAERMLCVVIAVALPPLFCAEGLALSSSCFVYGTVACFRTLTTGMNSARIIHHSHTYHRRCSASILPAAP